MLCSSAPAGRWRTRLPWPGRSSLRTKLGAVVLAWMTVGMAVAALFFVHQAQVEADAKARSLARQAVGDTVERMRAELERTFRAVPRTNNSVVALWAHGVRDRKTVNVLLKGVLEDNPDHFGAWTVWKPNAFDGRDAAFVNAPGSDASGRYLTYWHQNGMEIALDTVRDYATEPLFRTPLEKGVAFLSEPYFIRSNDQKIAAVSYSEPITSDERVVGAIGINIALKVFMEAIATLPMPQEASATFVSNGGTVVGLDGSEITERPLSDVRPDVVGEFAAAKHAGGLTIDADAPAGPALVDWAPLSEVDKPWFVRIEVPLSTFAFDAGRHQKPTIVALLCVVMATIIAILASLRQLVTQPLGRIETFVRALSQAGGNSACPGSSRNDEIGSIAKALTAFQSAEHEVRRLRKADEARETRFVEARRSELGEIADHLARTVQNVATIVDGTSHKIMRRAEAMTAAAVASADRTRAIVDTSNAADLSVGTVDRAAVALRGAIDHIAAEMRAARSVASKAADQARTSGSMPDALAGQAKRIGEVVDLISSIAQRTNMLALNATIEAARAGEAGRGFAVVAQEVKALAAQTTAATGEVGRQIEAMQSMAAQAADALVAIGGHVGAIDQISTSVAGAVHEQGQATEVISRSVEDAVAASRSVSQAIGEVDRAAMQVGDAAADMLIDITQLTVEVGRLHDEVRNAIERIRAA